MDCEMPVLDGYEATRQIRNEASPVRWHGIPIIAMTAHTEAEEREKCAIAGMNDFITKPVDVPTLVATIGRVMSTVTIPGRQVPGTTAKLPDVFDIDDLMRRTDFDHELAVEMVRAFLPDAEQRIKHLEHSLSRGDIHTALLTAHTLKGSAGNTGAAALSAIAHTLEEELRSDAGADPAPRIAELRAGLAEFRKAVLATGMQIR
jgi:CheY-like chemotaxis protein